MTDAELPHVLKLEHQELHEEIWKATKVPGETGQAAREPSSECFSRTS